jgi:hypothetical protein
VEVRAEVHGRTVTGSLAIRGTVCGRGAVTAATQPPLRPGDGLTIGGRRVGGAADNVTECAVGLQLAAIDTKSVGDELVAKQAMSRNALLSSKRGDRRPLGGCRVGGATDGTYSARSPSNRLTIARRRDIFRVKGSGGSKFSSPTISLRQELRVNDMGLNSRKIDHDSIPPLKNRLQYFFLRYV